MSIIEDKDFVFVPALTVTSPKYFTMRCVMVATRKHILLFPITRTSGGGLNYKKITTTIGGVAPSKRIYDFLNNEAEAVNNVEPWLSKVLQDLDLPLNDYILNIDEIRDTLEVKDGFLSRGIWFKNSENIKTVIALLDRKKLALLKDFYNID